jgi:hypothetical protein
MNHFDQVKRSAQYKFPRQKGVGGYSDGCGSVEGITWVDLSPEENAALDDAEAAWPPKVPKNVSSHGYPAVDVAKMIDHIVALEDRMRELERRLG